MLHQGLLLGEVHARGLAGDLLLTLEEGLRLVILHQVLKMSLLLLGLVLDNLLILARRPHILLLHDQRLVSLVGVCVVHRTLHLALDGPLVVLELLSGKNLPNCVAKMVLLGHLLTHLVVDHLPLHLLASKGLRLHLLSLVVRSGDEASKLLQELLLIVGLVLILLDVV